MAKESKVKNENYIQIQGWMVNELKLKGNELLTYAIIYGFSQADNQYFTGSSMYIADWLNVTKRTALDVLKSLTDKGLIEKQETYINDVKFCKYRVVKNLPQGDEEISPGVGKIFPQGGEEISPNNTNYIINNNKEYIKEYSSTSNEVDSDSILRFSTKTKNYTLTELKSFVEKKIRDISQQVFLDPIDMKKRDDLINIILYFYKQYNSKFKTKHPILSDIGYTNIFMNYFNPEGRNLQGGDDFYLYTELIDRYFEENFNARGCYNGKINFSLSHFMSGKIRDNLYNRRENEEDNLFGGMCL